MYLRRLLVTVLVGVAALANPAPAEAKGSFEIAEIQVPDADNAKATQKRVRLVRDLLRNAAKQADFGGGDVKIHAKLAQFEVEEEGDVVRVTCTLVGRLDGGPSARSHISFGGHPKERKKLEKQVLRMVSEGVMARLAELARRRQSAD